MIVKSSRDPDADLAELRERLGLHPELPVLEQVHLGAVAPLNGQLLICCHDEANADQHILIIDVDRQAENPWGEALDDQGQVTQEIIARCEHVVRAAYN